MTNIAQLFRDGGSLMWVNLIVLIFALAIVSERLFVLLFRLRINDKAFISAVEKLVMAGNFERAIKLCTSQEGAAVPRVVRSALANARMGGAAVSAAVEEAMTEVVPQVTRRAGILWGIANLATLIGLVGTVWGLIESFAAVSLVSPDQKSTKLTEGIAHAMANTFFGLGIAVTCVFFHMILSVMVKNVMDGLDHSAIRIENILAKRRIATGGRETGTPAAAST
ncbi:MAG: MotA/TolQ/ExbB proton channel family protein [Myxococcota bacterium]